MAWTPEQREAIFESYWREGIARCPGDNAVLKMVRRSSVAPGDGYVLLVGCVRCGVDVTMGPADDPRRPQFREWHPNEVSALLAAYADHGHGRCPVCETSLDMQVRVKRRHRSVVIECARCGNLHRDEQPVG